MKFVVELPDDFPDIRIEACGDKGVYPSPLIPIKDYCKATFAGEWWYIDPRIGENIETDNS